MTQFEKWLFNTVEPGYSKNGPSQQNFYYIQVFYYIQFSNYSLPFWPKTLQNISKDNVITLSKLNYWKRRLFWFQSLFFYPIRV